MLSHPFFKIINCVPKYTSIYIILCEIKSSQKQSIMRRLGKTAFLV